jgi:hypothetical protein
MSTLDRMQVLIEHDDHQKLAEMAARKGRSASDLIREWVHKGVAEEDRDSQKAQVREALEWFDRLRAEIEAKHGVLHWDPIEEVRLEADSWLDSILKDRQ